jgi:CBS domain-containing protein
VTARRPGDAPATGSGYPGLGALSVGEAMHPGLISCAPDTPLRAVARMMATYRVHAILVTAHGDADLPDGGRWGIVTDAGLLRAAAGADVDALTAGTVAAAPVLTAGPRDDLAAAARRLAASGASHVVVLEQRSSRPLGVLSTLDVARALAGFPERHPAGR